MKLRHTLVCPVCYEQLSLDTESVSKYKSVRCLNGHLYDFAKQSYLNLLLSQHKRSKHPGDTQEMVQARTRFLNQGFYQSILDFIFENCIQAETIELLLRNQDFHYSDLACGEGYYTHNIHEYLRSQKRARTHSDTEFSNKKNVIYTTGLDISTPAIKSACQRSKEIQWLIASLARVPLAENSQDLITGLFFHFDFKEIKRLLKPKGCFIMVTIGGNHLIELREKLYDTLKPEKEKSFSDIDPGLIHKEQLSLQKIIEINSAENIQALLTMTPHYWRSTLEKKHQLEALTNLSVTIDIKFDIFQKV